jgi:hypothetical protein
MLAAGMELSPAAIGQITAPNLNPIEMVLAKLKTLLCKVDERSVVAVV